MQANTYLFFDGNCEEAFKYYEKHLGAAVEALLRQSEMSGGNPPPERRDKIMHGRLRIGETVVLASDAAPYTKPKGLSVALGVATKEDASRIFKALADGGVVRMELQETFFSPAFGTLTDKFGIPWMVVCEGPH